VVLKLFILRCTKKIFKNSRYTNWKQIYFKNFILESLMRWMCLFLRKNKIKMKFRHCQTQPHFIVNFKKSSSFFALNFWQSRKSILAVGLDVQHYQIVINLENPPASLITHCNHLTIEVLKRYENLNYYITTLTQIIIRGRP